MSRLIEELKRKYRTPQLALAALGLDTALLRHQNDAAIPKQETTHMTLTRKAAMVQGALAVFLAPRLAQDAKLELTPLLAGITAKNYKEKIPTLAADIKKATAGKLGKDAQGKAFALDGMEDLMNSMAPMNPAEGVDTDPSSGMPFGSVEEMRKKTMDADPAAKIMEMLQGKVDEATMAAIMQLLKPAEPAATATPPGGTMDNLVENPNTAVPAKDKEPEADMVSKPTMDAALKAHGEAVEKRIMAGQKARHDAFDFVRPWVGQLPMALDSAEAVHRAALKVLGHEVEADVPPQALPAIIRALPLPGAKKVAAEHVAMDAAAAESYATRFPEAARIRHV